MAAQLVQALAEAGLLAPRLEFGERRLERRAQLQRRLAPALGVEVGARAQRELLACEHRVAAREHGGEALLRAQRRAARARAGAGARGSSRARSQRPPATRSPSPKPTRTTSACASATGCT